MTTFPNAIRLIKGASIGIDLANPVSSVAAFQYNLGTTMTRRLEARMTVGMKNDLQQFVLLWTKDCAVGL